jgi:hypothetical protein
VETRRRELADPALPLGMIEGGRASIRAVRNDF